MPKVRGLQYPTAAKYAVFLTFGDSLGLRDELLAQGFKRCGHDTRALKPGKFSHFKHAGAHWIFWWPKE